MVGYCTGHSMVCLRTNELGVKLNELGVKFNLPWVVWTQRSSSSGHLLPEGQFQFHQGMLCPGDLLLKLRDKLDRKV